MRYEVYVSASCSASEAKALPWITYDEAMSHLPQALAAAAAGNDRKIASVRVNDAEAVLEAGIAGLGRSLLPCVVGDGDSRLRRLDAKGRPPAVNRELWLLAHSELRTLGRIQAVVDWIEQTVPR